NTVFFLCDVQESYRSTVYQFDSVVSTVQKMADAAEILDVKLWVKATAPTIFGSTVEDLDLRNVDSQISTSRFSMCDELINRSLKDRNLQNVILFGLEAHIGIAQTAVDLMNESIEVYILHDAVSSRNQGEISIALKRLENLGATITTSEAILFQLVRHTAHPKFEAISELVE
ncbi:Isochorismatase-like protein, partial [Paraphysoderma sedebokerense]